MLLSTAWFPPVDYFALLAAYPQARLEACESYRKQSWRNRCRILAPDGPSDMHYPVVHGGSRLITDVRVDWSTPWPRRFLYALDTAYYSSPFYEYYRDGLSELLSRRRETLWEMNLDSIRFLCAKTGIAPQLDPTCDFEADAEEDLRNVIDPKKPPLLLCRPYWQVFRERFGFVQGLSTLDLLFNEGPESLGYLLSCSQLRSPLTELSR